MPQNVIYSYGLLIKSSVIEDSSSETFLGIIIDSNFTFEKHK